MKGIKEILIGTVLITAVALVVLMVINGLVYREMGVSDFTDSLQGKEYEETDGFTMNFISVAVDIERGLINQERIEGENEKEVIIKVAEGDKEDISYKREDLIEWAQEDSVAFYGTICSSEYEMLDPIIVCQEEQGRYYYYSYEELAKLVRGKELGLESEYDESIGVILKDIKNGYYDSMNQETMFKVLDKDGNVRYETCWTIPGIEEVYLPTSGKSLVEIANEDDGWNGSLQKLIGRVDKEIEQTRAEDETYQQFKKMQSKLESENTNIRYLFVDLKNEKAYSNEKKYEEYENFAKNVKEIEALGKYIKSVPEEYEWETNLTGIDEMDWENIQYSSEMGIGEQYLYIIGLDTQYPVEDVFYEAREMYNTQMPITSGLLIAMFVLFIVAMVVLTAITGRVSNQEEIVLTKFDRIKSELACAIIIVSGVVVVVLLAIIESALPYHPGAPTTVVIYGVMALMIAVIGLFGYLSLVRRIKAQTLWGDSIIKKSWEFGKEVFQERKSTTKKLLMFGGVALLAVIGIVEYSFEMVFLALIAGGAVFLYELRAAIATQKIRQGLKAITEGDIEYQIQTDRMRGDQKEIAEKINSLSEGLENAVEKSMKDERMKTELITNVSHDIKTPLTSIINYVDLLKREKFKDPKIQAYLEVLDEKSQRLKTLAEDVVEASKVTSGNINLEFTTVNFVEMVQQSEGEFKEKFKDQQLELIMNYPKEPVLVSLDGKYMWRVLENIFGNVGKYAMTGTRVYGDLQETGSKAIFSLKNVSAKQLNITTEELTERFIRGDEARSTEGNGLGLSIAKSLVELQKGQMELKIDGDLFKVTIEFLVK